MTARSIISPAGAAGRSHGAPFLGFGTAFRKELTEWRRGPKALVIAGVSTAVAVFTTLLAVIEAATVDPGEVIRMSADPTANVMFGWTGQIVGLIAVVATMALISTERDRGTLAWSLANPVSPTAILAAKYGAALIMIGVAAVLVPMAVSVAVAVAAYGGLADLSTVAAFTLIFMAVPALYVALNVALGAGIRSTVGVAAVALAVLFVPELLGQLVPAVATWSPTSIGLWAQAFMQGQPAPWETPVAWAVSMVVLIVSAVVVFDRQEF